MSLPNDDKYKANNPFRTYANYVYPKTIYEAIRWGVWFWDRNHKYRTSITRVISYFLSSITVVQKKKSEKGAGTDSDVVTNFKKLLEDDYKFMALIQKAGLQLAAMGNVFVSAERIFRRDLLCPHEDCGSIFNIAILQSGVDYRWDGTKFTGVCPKCKRTIVWKDHDDLALDDQGHAVRFVFRAAQDMIIKYNQLTDTYKFLYRMPGHIKSAIQRGESVYLETTPRLYLQAAYTNGLIEFKRDSLFFMRTSTLTELDNYYKGWGVPLFLPSFSNLLRLATLDRFNEVVAMDYIAPVRMLSPDPAALKAGTGEDPLRAPVSGANFKGFMQSAIKQAKNNPSTWIISPFAVNYQMLGGEAKEMAQVDLMEWYNTQVQSDCGIPAEFRQTQFQMVASTMGLRMFERMWIHMAKDLDAFARWCANHIAVAHKLEDMIVSLDATSFVEDDLNKQVKIQLMTAGQISKSRVLADLGIDYEEDMQKRYAEQKREAEEAGKQERDTQNSQMVQGVVPPAAAGVQTAQNNITAQQRQQAGIPAAPGAPTAPAAPAGMLPGGPGALPYGQGASENATMDALFSQAQDTANQIYALPPTQRISALRQLKATNPPLHAQVKQILETMEAQIASEAVAQSKQGQG